ncbi:alpha/beta hydrolase [Nocardiopsis alba]|uniref:alpha/beta hydrolase n=1 Tax=Nocardiopsis alba TaxID=53437 RepID=UPI0033A07D22
MRLGLPEDIEADEAGIRDSASDLLSTRGTMLGYTTDLEAGFRNTANEFTDTIAWNITEASAREIQTWQDVAEHLTHGSGTLNLYAAAVEDYREARSDLQSRWDEYKSAALGRIDEFGADTLTAEGVSQETAEQQYLETVRSSLLTEHTWARSDLDDATDDAKSALTNGPSTDSWQRIEDAGLMTGREIFLFGGQTSAEVEFGPQDDWSAEEVVDWWWTLAPNQQDHLMEEYPNELRNRDGVPVVVRDELNRAHLAEEIERYSQGNTQRLVDTLEGIRTALEGDDKFLIYYDPDAGHAGQAAISTGNPDLADNVMTMVPGMFNNMSTMEEPLERSEAIHERMTAQDPESEHASIVWMGYDAPPFGEWDSVNSATALASFQEGLRATHQGDQPSHNSVLGHSFGAFVTGAAANADIVGGLEADSLIFVGGAGASVDHIGDLTVDEENVHVIQGDDDWIEDARDRLGIVIEGFGTPLDNDEFFEDRDNPGEELGHRLDPEEDTDHSGYFEDAETLDYLGDVLTRGSGQ